AEPVDIVIQHQQAARRYHAHQLVMVKRQARNLIASEHLSERFPEPGLLASSVTECLNFRTLIRQSLCDPPAYRSTCTRLLRNGQNDALVQCASQQRTLAVA